MLGVRRVPISSLALFLVLGACSDDASGSGSGSEEGQTGTSETQGSEDAGQPELSEDYGPVRGGLDITEIEMSQSVVQTLYVGGAVVDPASYIVPVVPRRFTIFRALWDTPDGWTERPLIARLHVRRSDGVERVFEDFPTTQGEPTLVSGSSLRTSLFTSFFWRLEPEFVEPGLSYRVSVVEAEPGEEIPAGTGLTQWPSEDFTQIEVEAEPASLRVALVGVRYEVPGCSSDTSMLPADELEAIRAGFEVWNGVETDSVILDTSISVDIDEPVGNVSLLLPRVSQLRAEFGEETPEVFFFIMLDDCSVVSQGVLGVAPLNAHPPLIEDAATRFGAGLWNPHDVSASVNTLVHEVGHSQGAPHAPCGVFDTPDPNYPHAQGSIGVRGLDPLTGAMYTPNQHTDFMGYCQPYWLSDYRFGLSYEHQRIITSWGARTVPAAVPEDYAGAVLSGIVSREGESQWWINDNPRPPIARVDGPLRVAFDLGQGPQPVAVDVRELPDLPGSKLVQVPLRAGMNMDALTGISVSAAPGEAPLTLELDAPELFDARELVFEVGRPLTATGLVPSRSR